MADVRLYLPSRERTAEQDEPRNNSTLSEQARHLLKTSVHQELLKRVDLERLSMLQSDQTLGRQRLMVVVLQLLSEQSVPLSTTDRDEVSSEILDEVFGLGPLEPLLKDPTVDDVLVNTYTTVYAERRGILERTSISFRDNAHLMHIIDKIVSAVGRRIDESTPMVDARMLDGSRVNVVIPPLAVDGPMLSIRRFRQTPLTADDLLRYRTLIPQMLEVLRSAVQGRLNIVVSGGTGAGKTTLLNVLSAYISSAERIVTIEDSAELKIKQDHVVRLECRPPNLERKGAVKARELLLNALRMRPDRIIVGEVRGEEALDMLQAMNTGHSGSITTVHANTPRDAISRIETMALMGSVALPERAIRAQIVSAIDLIVQVARMSDGTRRITHITEVTGSSGEMISLQDIFKFERQGLGAGGKVHGRFVATGIVPKFADRLAAAGINLSLNQMDQTVEV